jgi:hypothetical protein
MTKHDDYELYEKDYNEFIRRGMEAFGMEEHPGRDGYKQKGSDGE